MRGLVPSSSSGQQDELVGLAARAAGSVRAVWRRGEEDADEQSTDGQHANASYIRLPRSLDAQPAQQAQCKVRTEVTEVTRGMLDRSNANFLLWPPCVEVQRCSGCCNTKSLHCVPVLTHTRYLQVMRIQYINKRPHYDKAVVSVSDHVECRCEPAPRSAGGSKKKHRQGHKERVGKSHTKEALHGPDQLKQNQLQDLLKGSPWQHDSGPSPKIPLRWDEGRADFLLPDRMHHGKGQQRQGSRNETVSVVDGRGESVRGHHHGDGEGGWGHRGDTFAAVESSTGHPQHRPKTPSDGRPEADLTRGGVETQIHHPIQHRYDLSKMAAAANQKHTPSHRLKLNQSEYDNQNHEAVRTNQTGGQRLGFTEVTNQSGERKDNPTLEANQGREQGPAPTELTNHRPTGNETPEGRLGEEVREPLEEEKRELLLLHRRLDEEKQLLQQQQHTHTQHHRTTIRTDTTAPASTATTTTATTTSTATTTTATTASTATATTATTTTAVAQRPRAPPRPPPPPPPPTPPETEEEAQEPHQQGSHESHAHVDNTHSHTLWVPPGGPVRFGPVLGGLGGREALGALPPLVCVFMFMLSTCSL
ncbi:uncharacterized protein pdgfbb isoform X3 [Alosa sapidissima]|uniref:uncharacterized protein pdgfbb isoform X3 n=1 Tax=Alosa sapidissima TaxID=34773 RepID=UPI001C0862FE|nr:uncharacterized protein pdgfbb isoform X3 [Alosa sapidissima]